MPESGSQSRALRYAVRTARRANRARFWGGAKQAMSTLLVG
jgi:hypothetical protein